MKVKISNLFCQSTHYHLKVSECTSLFKVTTSPSTKKKQKRNRFSLFFLSLFKDSGLAISLEDFHTNNFSIKSADPAINDPDEGKQQSPYYGEQIKWRREKSKKKEKAYEEDEEDGREEIRRTEGNEGLVNIRFQDPGKLHIIPCHITSHTHFHTRAHIYTYYYLYYLLSNTHYHTIHILNHHKHTHQPTTHYTFISASPKRAPPSLLLSVFYVLFLHAIRHRILWWKRDLLFVHNRYITIIWSQ